MSNLFRTLGHLATCAVFAAAIAMGPGAAARTPAGAQTTDDFALPFAPTPAEVFGVPCKASPGTADFAASLQCLPADVFKQPSISVTATDWKSHPTRAEMIANMREAFHERAIFKVIREEDFAPPGDPDAVGFRALYQTDLGNRYVWAVLSKGRMVRVIVAVFAPIDFAAMTADVEAKIFVVPRPSR